MYRSRSVTWLLLAVIWSPLAFSGVDQTEAGAWLKKMAKALHEENYSGTFTYMRGGEFNAMQIVHQYEDGHETERLLQLNGEKLEIRRVDGEIVCRHEKSAHVDLDHHVALGPFSSAFSENLAAFRDLYRFTLHGEGRIAGRPAVKLAISPRYNDRYGYRLWLDKDTGLLLQSHLIDVDRKRVREIFQFSSVRIGEDSVDPSLLASSLEGDLITHNLSGEVTSLARQDSHRPEWRVSWLPNGFKPVRVPGSDRLHFTDGIATFSVFIETPGESSMPTLPEMTTQMGGTVVITRRLDGLKGQITVVGEVPVRTAQKVAESIEPVIY